jgi:hypothetical protein
VPEGECRRGFRTRGVKKRGLHKYSEIAQFSEVDEAGRRRQQVRLRNQGGWGGGRRPVLVRFLSRSAKLQVVRNARQLRVLAYLLPRVVSP